MKTFGCRGQCNFILRLRDFETLLNFAETYEFSMEHSTSLTVGTNQNGVKLYNADLVDFGDLFILIAPVDYRYTIAKSVA